VPELLDLKRALFARLDAAAPRTAVLASSTTGIPPSSFTAGLAGRDRCIAVHPLNPPYLHPAVEVTRAPWTSDDCAKRTQTLMESIGQVPIMLRGEGQLVLTRLAAAILAEAFRMVEEGSASVEDVDKAMRDGLGLRYAFMGPFEVTDLNAPAGIADFISRYGPTFTAIRKAREGHATDWSAALVKTIDAQRRAILPLAELAKRMAWRDERLIEIAAYKRSIKDQ
jgi:3-hydroxyacyl-CoA dehydrogenase